MNAYEEEKALKKMVHLDIPSVPDFDTLVQSARKQQKVRAVRSVTLKWAAVLSLMFLPAAWLTYQPAPVIETGTVSNIFYWDAPSDAWFADLEDQSSDTDEDFTPSDELFQPLIQDLDSL